jgi:hypothetical protein
VALLCHGFLYVQRGREMEELLNIPVTELSLLKGLPSVIPDETE